MTVADEINPFGEGDSAVVNECLERCQRLKEFYGKCDNCGLDVSDLKDRLAKQQQFFDAVKSQFMPEKA